MIVVDASAWVRAVVDAGPVGEAARRELVTEPHWLVPAHAPLEVLRTIRRYETAGLLEREAADRHAAAVVDAEVRVIGPERWLLRATWRLRDNVSAYDAPYVAIARVHDAPLVTGDERLARAAVGLGVAARVLTESDS